MKLSNYVFPEKVIFAETLAKYLLTKPIVDSVYDLFTTKNKDNWKEYECTKECQEGTVLCKRHKVKEQVLASEKFAKFNNTVSSGNIVGPYLSKYYICWYNKKEELLLVINTPSITPKNDYEDISDVSLKKLNVFIFGGVEYIDFEKDTVQTIDIDDLMSQRSLTTKYNKDDNKILKLIKIYNTYVWEIISYRNNNDDNYHEEKF